MAQQDFSDLLSAAPSVAKPTAAPQEKAPAANQFADLLAIAPAAQAQGSGLFDALLMQESGGKQKDKSGAPVTSKKGAIGIAQVMPGTAPEAARLAGLPYDDMRYRTDAEYNKALGRAYFDKQLTDFGDEAKALAAYNAGPGAVAKAIKAAQDSGNPDGWLNFLPAETRSYVPAILSKSGAQTTRAQPQQADHSNTYKPPVQPRGMFGAVNDTVIELANAAAGGVKAASDFISPGNPVSRFIDDQIIKPGEASQSDQVKAEKSRLQDEMQSATGAADEVSAFLGYMARNPVLAAAQAAGSFVLPGGAAKGASSIAKALGIGTAGSIAAGTGAASVASGALSGGDAAGTAYELVMKTPDEIIAKSPQAQELMAGGRMDIGQAKEALATAAAREASVVPAAVGAALGPLGAERILAGAGRTGGRAAYAAKTGAVDAITGGAEEGITQFEGQAAAAKINPEIDPTKGVAGAATAGAVLEGAMGVGVGALAPKVVPPALQPVADKAAEPNSPLSKAAMAGASATAATPQPEQATPQVDPITARVVEIEDEVRQNGVLQTLRGIGQKGLTEKEFLEALAIARNPTMDQKSPLIRQRALESLEEALGWARDGRMPGLTNERGLATAAQPDQAGTYLATQQGGPLSTQGPADFFDPNTVDVDATRVDNMIGGPRAIEGPRARLGFDGQQQSPAAENLQQDAGPAATRQASPEPAAQPAPGMSAPASQDIPARPVQQTVEQATEGMPRVQIPAATAEDARTGNAPAARRKRRAQVEQLVGAGFETVERRDNQFVLKNAKTKQEVILDGAVEAQLARAAIARMVADKANTAAASPLNDRLEPTPAQIAAHNYKKSDVIELNGTKIVIENPAGSVRRGVGADGKAWETKMAHHYGEFVGTEGADGDRLDVFIGHRPDSAKVYVVDQKNQDGSFDEHKIVMGATTEDQARQVYLSNYEKGWSGLGAITEMSLDDFKAWAKSERAKQPLMYGKQDKVITVNDGGNPVQILPLDAADVGESSAARTGKGKVVSKKDAELIRSIAAIFGVDAQFFRPVTPGFSADGFFNGGNTLYINERTTVTPLAIFGHEFMHLIKGRMPQAYDSIAKVVSANVKDPKGYRADYYGKAYADEKGDAALTPDELEELVSDLNGNLMTDAKFWRDVFAQVAKDHGKEAKGIIARLSAFLGNAIDMVVSGLKGGKFNAGQFVNNTKDIRAAFKDGLAQYLAASDISKTAMQAEILRAQQKNKSTEIKRSERRDVTETEEFKRWFGDSKVVDAQGMPLVVYHGTQYDFNAFDPEMQGDTVYSGDIGFFFTNDKKEASAYATYDWDRETPLPNVMPVYLSLQNPLIVDISNPHHKGEAPGVWYDEHGQRMAQYAEDSGHDGLIVSDFGGGASKPTSSVSGKQTMYVAFSPTQIKSATGNNGQFDPNSPDIRKSTARPADGLTVEGYHFSKEARPTLTTGAFGTGLQGSDRDEIMAAKDGRLKQRLSFYVNKGTGVRPESGVGGIAHKAELTNLYDADADTKRLKQGRGKRDFESAVLDAGYSGYLTRLDGTQPGQAILLGSQTIRPEVLGPRTQIADAKVVPAPAQREMDLGDKIMANKSLPAGQMDLGMWSRILMAVVPDVHAQLNDIGAFDGDAGKFYKDELVSRARKLMPQIKKSAERAKQEYAEVEAKFRDTDAWMKAPNGQPTRLTPRQWVQTRTPSFQKWFGPWEEAAKSGGVWARDDVSKVVDDNGEPLVVYHGATKGGFSEFNQPGGTKRGDLGIFATDNWDMARSYVRKGRADAITEDDVGDDAAPGIYALFLNIKNPNEADFEGALWNGSRDHQWVVEYAGEQQYTSDGKGYFDSKEEAAEFAETFVNPDENEEPLDYARGADDHHEDTDGVVREAIRSKNDGAIIRQVIDDGGGPGGYDMTPADVYVALSPEQVKSADFNGGEFSEESRDIRKSAPRQDPAIGDKTDVSKLPTGRPIPASVAVGSLEQSLELARSKSYNRGRELKQDIQAKVLAAAKAAGVNLEKKTKEAFKFLSGMVVADARFALKSNENAVGWYDQKVSRAIGALSTVHPEINADPRSRLAFLWALATTSNGLKVDKNFELAEKAYRDWKASGVMPGDAGIGNAAQQINNGLSLHSELSKKVGDERLMKFMSTMFTVGEIKGMLDTSVGGEWNGTPVRGAAILGPKIGNGFFSNLNGYFDALTMDRWLMRTWGRMTGTLLNIDQEAIRDTRSRLASAISGLSAGERKVMGSLIGRPLRTKPTRAELDDIAKASQKASMKKDKRDAMMASVPTDTFRKAANRHHVTLDGQKEAPSGPAERNWIRAVFQEALDSLQADGIDMTMSDLQALLWYPERRLYDAAKSDEEVSDGYEDDEAPDYANAAMNLALANGVSKSRVMAAMDAAEARGTVRGEQLSAEEKAQMLSEFRAAPPQAVNMLFEVAPDPANAELTAEWGALSSDEKSRITKLAKDAVLADVVDAVGAKVGKTVMAIGGYMGLINPNLITEYKQTQVPIEQARALASAIGMAFGQDSVAMVDPRASYEAGIVRVTLSVKAEKVADKLFSAIRKELPGLDAFTARGNNFDVLNFTDMPTDQLAGKIEEIAARLDEGVEASVSHGTTKSELVEKADYEGHIKGLRPESGQELLERVQRARDRAREIVADELRASGAVAVPGRPGGARRNDGAAQADTAGRPNDVAVREQGGLRRSPGRLAGEGRQDQIAGREEDGSLSGLPRNFDVAGKKIYASHWAPAEDVARAYMEAAGLPYSQPVKYAKVDPERATRIAAEYDKLKHDPQNPEVKAAYAALVKETAAQYQAVVDSGLAVEFIDFAKQGDPYAASPRLATEDVRDNNHMWVFSTRDGFGSAQSFDPEDNPLLAETDFIISGKKALVNDLFRVVHDYFGHVKEGVGFRADGEENTWRSHSAMFSPLAQRALTTETRGQNSWVNYGPHGAKNRTASAGDTHFADQKTGLMPLWVSEDGRIDADQQYNDRIDSIKELISCLRK